MRDNPILKIHKFVFLIEKGLDRKLHSAIGLSFSQCMILVHIAHNPEISQRHVACERDITAAAVSRHIEALESLGFISREDNRVNKREHVLHITLSGKDIVDHAEKVIEQEVEFFSEYLEKKERDSFSFLCDKLISRLDNFS